MWYQSFVVAGQQQANLQAVMEGAAMSLSASW
jgi:hypothetical protein